MTVCKVVGTVVCPVENPRLRGQKLLVCQPVDMAGKPAGESFVAIDRVQAGEGDLVLTNKEGGGARIVLRDDQSPVQQMVVAVIDGVHLDRGRKLDPAVRWIGTRASA
jgi:microcompartment protein CcmK/EutM